MMEQVTITVDKQQITVPSNLTVLEACKKANVDIPTLCHLNMHNLKMVNQVASCRICVVEQVGRANLLPSCATPVQEGMEIITNSVRVLNARKTVLELMLSDHPKDCLICSKSGECELQDMSERFGVRSINISGDSMSSYKKETSVSIIRDMDKCIMCRRCETMCNDVQTVGALSAINRGFDTVVSTPFEVSLRDSVCTYCGQCVQVCPVGALTERDRSWEVIEALADPEKTVVFQTAPATRVAIGEEFGYEPGTIVTGKMVAALKALGADYVFDTDFAADLTIMEEATELIDRVSRHLNGDKDVRLPLLTSCCPAWVNFIESQFPDLLDVPSTAKSPQQMMGVMINTYFAEKLNIDRKNMVVVSVMPCLAKKHEATLPKFQDRDNANNPDVDIVITTRELAHLIQISNVDFRGLEDKEYDNPMGESTGAGVIFGASGGVIEAATRTAAEWLSGKDLKRIDFKELRGKGGMHMATVPVTDELELNIAIASGLGNARDLLEEIRNGNPRNLHAIEIMACPGGCINGGGQPYIHRDDEVVLQKRREGIYKQDVDMPLRKSHKNPSIQKVYDEFLGHPNSHKAHELLHTFYDPYKNKV